MRPSRPAVGWSQASALRAALLAGAFVLSAACAVTLISKYDEQVDKAATALQQDMDRFLTRLGSDPQPSYDTCQEFYDSYEVQLRSVLIRAQSHPKNERTEQQLELMLKNLAALRELHQAGPIDGRALATTRSLFNQGWRAVITLEVAKKRGAS